jgi:hypothetical protein
MREDRRAVSNVLGFVLVFSLIVGSVGLVTVYGLGSLQDVRDYEQTNNAERAFDVLADNLDDVVHYRAPSRATEIKLSDASLRPGDPTTVTVEITNGGSPTPTYSVAIDPIVYSANGANTRIVYANGAVIRQEPGGAVMVREPAPVFTDQDGERVTVLPLVQTRLRSDGIGGSATVLVRADRVGSEPVVGDLDGDGSFEADADAHSGDLDGDGAGDDDEEYDVTLRIETTGDRAIVWDRFFDERLEPVTGDADACSRSAGTVTCSFPTDRLHVTVTRVDVTLG